MEPSTKADASTRANAKVSLASFELVHLPLTSAASTDQRDRLNGLLQQVFRLRVPIDPAWATFALQTPETREIVAVLMVETVRPVEGQPAPAAADAEPCTRVYRLWNVAVPRPWRRCGLFRELFSRFADHVLRTARTEETAGSVRLTLDVWASNRRAQRAYRAIGFSIVSRSKRWHPTYQETCIYYTMDLMIDTGTGTGASQSDSSQLKALNTPEPNQVSPKSS